jgi:hypothetical protein
LCTGNNTANSKVKSFIEKYVANPKSSFNSKGVHRILENTLPQFPLEGGKGRWAIPSGGGYDKRKEKREGNMKEKGGKTKDKCKLKFTG